MRWAHFLFLRFKSASSSFPLKRRRSSFTSSRSMFISLSKALAFASAIFLSSSISSIRFLRSPSKALICSTVLLILLITVPSVILNLPPATLKTFAALPLAKIQLLYKNPQNKQHNSTPLPDCALHEKNHLQKTGSPRTHHKLQPPQKKPPAKTSKKSLHLGRNLPRSPEGTYRILNLRGTG